MLPPTFTEPFSLRERAIFNIIYGRQVLMALMDWATHVLQWRSQKEAMMQIGANPQKSS